MNPAGPQAEKCATCGAPAGPEGNRIPDPDDVHGSGAICFACGGDYDRVVHLYAKLMRAEFAAERAWDELRGMV